MLILVINYLTRFIFQALPPFKMFTFLGKRKNVTISMYI